MALFEVGRLTVVLRGVLLILGFESGLVGLKVLCPLSNSTICFLHYLVIFSAAPLEEGCADLFHSYWALAVDCIFHLCFLRFVR